MLKTNFEVLTELEVRGTRGQHKTQIYAILAIMDVLEVEVEVRGPGEANDGQNKVTGADLRSWNIV